MADKKISELDQTLNLDEQAEFPLSQDNGGTPTTFKAKLTQIAVKILEAITNSNLHTTDKTVIGAINELKDGGGGGGASELNDLDDVNISSPTDGQALVYDDASDKWVNGDVDAEFDITTAINTPAPIQTFSDGGDNIPMKSCEVAIVAQQASGTPSPSNPLSITGFSSVSVGNYAKYHRIIASSLTPQSQGGITITPKADGVFEITGTSTEAVAINFAFDEFTIFSDDTRTININNDFASNAVTVKYNYGSTTIDTWTLTTINRTYTNFGLLSGKTINNLTIGIASGTTVNGKLKTEFLVTNTGTTTTVSLGQTIYGGTGDLVNGTGIKTHENIASYNGESINEPWLCSEAPFVIGTTPPTGSQVVYPLTTPTAFTFTAANIPTLSGTNNVYADSGDINSLEYFNDKGDDIADLHKALGEPLHIYSTDEKVVGKWIDGSTVYEKTFNLQNEISIDTSNWTSLGVSLSGVDTPISIEARSSRAINSSVVVDVFDSPMTAKGLDKIKSLTIRYTKSST